MKFTLRPFRRAALVATLAFFIPLTSCENEIKLTDEEVVAGLKEALSVGTTNSVNVLSVDDGYFADAAVKILFPDDAAIVESTLRSVGLGSVVDAFILKLNLAAEQAAEQAEPIFLNAITDMTVDDGMTILMGADNAATTYLSDKTRSSLYTEFKPDIEAALASVGATTAWDAIIDTYNSIPLTTPANDDLPDYTTNKALDGLFNKIAGEELKIRTDVNARVSDLLKKVFGEQD